MGAVASAFAPPPPPTLTSALFSWKGTLLVTGLTMLASTIGAAGVSSDERALRKNPAMRDAEERIRQLEAQLGERQGGHDMLAVVKSLMRITETRRRLEYVDGLVHLAVAGTAGSGKSSLINSIRGLQPGEPGAAKVGTVETTKKVGRYPDDKIPLVWYDIPGVGTLNQPEARYFLDQGLYMFECIIVLFDARFTAADVAILRCCQELNIPAYIVRSKALQHINNSIEDMMRGGRTDGDSGMYRDIAKGKLIRETQRTVVENLRTAGLQEQRVYVVDRKTMLQVVQGEDDVPNLVHERELLHDVIAEMKRRRENELGAPST